MGIFIVLTTLSDEGRLALKKDPARIKDHNRQLEALGVKILAQYAALGQYDFINVFEAPNADTIFKAAVKYSGRGLQSSITLTAKTIDDFIACTK